MEDALQKFESEARSKFLKGILEHNPDGTKGFSKNASTSKDRCVQRGGHRPLVLSLCDGTASCGRINNGISLDLNVLSGAGWVTLVYIEQGMKL